MTRELKQGLVLVLGRGREGVTGFPRVRLSAPRPSVPHRTPWYERIPLLTPKITVIALAAAISWVAVLAFFWLARHLIG